MRKQIANVLSANGEHCCITKGDPEDTLEYQQAFAVLRKAGCTTIEMELFIHLRQTYQPTEKDQAPLDYRHLEFLRWLIAQGKLTEQLR